MGAVSLLMAATPAGRKFIVFGNNNFSYRSDDGSTGSWTAGPTKGFSTLGGVAAGPAAGTLVVAATGSITTTKISYDWGASWTTSSAFSSIPFFGLAYGNGIYIGLRTNSTTNNIYSGNALTWSTFSPPEKFSNITFADGLFIAVTTTGKVYSATDQSNFTLRHTLGVSKALTKPEYNNGYWLIGQAGADASFTGRYLYSTNGTSWTESNYTASPSLTTPAVYAIGANKNSYILSWYRYNTISGTYETVISGSTNLTSAWGAAISGTTAVSTNCTQSVIISDYSGSNDKVVFLPGPSGSTTSYKYSTNGGSTFSSQTMPVSAFWYGGVYA